MDQGTYHRLLWRILKRSFLFIALCLAFAIAPRSSYALDAVDITIDAFAVGGAAIGIPITDSEKKLLKPLLSCIVDGEPVVNCGKKAIIQQLPPESQKLVGCIVDGKNVAQCAKDEALSHLPPNSQQLANCVATRADITECGKIAATEAEKAAFTAAEALKVGEATGPIQNIINTVDAIAREDWQKVLENGGKAVAKYVINAVITALLPGAGVVIAPVVNAVVDFQFNLVVDLINAIKANDWAAIARIGTEAYLGYGKEVVCSVIPAGAVKEAICGTLGKVISALGKTAGAITGVVLDAIGDILKFTGISDIFKGIGKIFGLGKDDNCGTAEQYYADRFLICYNKGAYLNYNDPDGFDKFANSLWDPCFQHFYRCHDKQPSRDICHAMVRQFREHAETLQAAMIESARGYAKSRRSYVEANRSRICSPHYYQSEADNFLNGCENALKKTYPLIGDATSPDCRPDPKRCAGMFVCSTPSAHQVACQRAANGALKRTTAEVCVGAGQCFKIDTPPKDELYLR
jgi:hypothetical protein